MFCVLTARVNKPDNAAITETSIILITVDITTPIKPPTDMQTPSRDNIFLFTSPPEKTKNNHI